MLNLPNLAWSVAFIPWVLAGDRSPGSPSRSDCRLCAANRSRGRPPGRSSRVDRPAPARPAVGGSCVSLAGLALGALLAAAQLVPTLLASVRAHRGALATPDFWSLHPLSLWEVVAPNLFGNYYDAFLADLPWMGALNFGRDPFFYSLYLGPFVLVLAIAGAARSAATGSGWPWRSRSPSRRLAATRRSTRCCGVSSPWLMYFRFPVKYIVFAVFAVAVLAADGWRHGSGASGCPRWPAAWSSRERSCCSRCRISCTPARVRSRLPRT
jgi:hypothetical protein